MIKSLQTISFRCMVQYWWQLLVTWPEMGVFKYIRHEWLLLKVSAKCRIPRLFILLNCHLVRLVINTFKDNWTLNYYQRFQILNSSSSLIFDVIECRFRFKVYNKTLEVNRCCLCQVLTSPMHSHLFLELIQTVSLYTQLIDLKKICMYKRRMFKYKDVN